MHALVLTIFPGLVDDFFQYGIPRIAREKGLLQVDAVDLRRFTSDFHGTLDDRPYGGGPGMVMLAAPIFEAVETLDREHGPSHRILLTPQGRRLDQPALRELAQKERLLILSGRYEGIDERVRLGMQWDEVSLGDFVLSGGELAALSILDGVARLLPGVLGHPESSVVESFEDGLLEGPQYTRPREYRNLRVPDVLLSGDHAAIAAWRHEQALARTRERRADLLEKRDEQQPRPDRDPPTS